jgi:crotonobetainyl-CoA:carnitine CoA-transferase CaiB-like acyl-CoA transferase
MATPNGAALPSLPLTGIRALNCTHWNAGPLAMRFMADLGADVIKIESIQHPDPLRGSTGGTRDSAPPKFYERMREWIYLTRNQRGLTLDLESKPGAEVFLTLVAKSDIVAQNLRPGVWERWGFAYEKLKAINPGIIVVQMPGYGVTGPWRNQPSWANSVDQMAGFSGVTGYHPDVPFTNPGWPDYANGLHVAFALLAALWRRRRTGHGEFLDLSQVEVGTAMNPEPLLDYQLNGRVWKPQGNRSRWGMAPHGCYRCEREGDWIAIAVGSDEQWQALTSLIPDAAWVKDERFATMEGRRSHEDELNRHLETWTQSQDKYDVMRRLQEAGVPATVVAYGADLTQDEYLWERGSLERVQREIIGERIFVGAPFRYSETPIRTRRPAPTLGQHNYEILSELAGLSQEEISDLEARKIIGTEPL